MASIERSTVNAEPIRKSNLPIFFIVGGPGSGKGTQCDKLITKYGFKHLSSGDLLRHEVELKTPRGQQMQSIMTAGELVPLEIVLDLVKETMVKELGKGAKGYLVDGYPREVVQGQKFEAEIAPPTRVIYFEVSEATLIKRLLKRAETSGRADDNLETIKKRLKTFYNATTPVVEHYKKQGKLNAIPAEGSVDDIFAKTCQAIDAALKK